MPETDFIDIHLPHPIKPNLSILLLLSYRKGNQVLLKGNKIVGMRIHKDDLKDLEKLVAK